ncbi:IS1380 family transposase [Prevotella multiformis]|uniref:IS1380 family transposase n=1 Tax=Prevotella multiformis TaxID=282402 RepID=UPI001BA531D3|nr:IS1380 family transposase [Prevotella multiformis]QUB71681.1 IS1380 family transposase [Prevotella multiformis]
MSANIFFCTKVGNKTYRKKTANIGCLLKNENITPYGGIFYVMDEFKCTGVDRLVDSRLNTRCQNYGYQYSDIMLALFCIYLCGGDHIEDITAILKKYLSTAPDAKIPSSDTIARGLKELRSTSIAYTSQKGGVYMHDPAMKLNSLLLEMTLLLGLLKRGQGIDVDFDNEFIPAEKNDAPYSYKKKRGYFPGVMTSGPLIIGIENRQGNSNVKFEQVEELTHMFDNIEAHGLHIRTFRADCGLFIKELVEELTLRTETFYLRAGSCAWRRGMYEQCTEWRRTVANGQEMDVASFEFADFLSDWHLRLVVQRTEMDTAQGEQFLPGMQYIYRAILTNDHDSTEEQVVDKYNQRGACEKNFDVQNSDFGWAHLPFSMMEDNTVFLLFTAMLKNFYQYLLTGISRVFPGVDMKSRLKRFIFSFIVVPAK